MILSLNGLLKVGAIYVNLVQIALFLDIDTQTTRQLAKHPYMRLAFLYAFSYSVYPDKMACALAVAIFFVFEVQNFVTDTVSSIGDKVNGDDNEVAEVSEVAEVADDGTAI